MVARKGSCGKKPRIGKVGDKKPSRGTGRGLGRRRKRK